MADVEIQDGSDDEEGADLMDFIETDRNLDEEKELVDPQVQALHDAIEEGREEQAQQLLADPASAAWCTAQGVDGDTALHLACLYGRAQLVPLLISKGASVNATDMNGSTPLHDASAGGFLQICQQLLAANAAVTVQDEDGDTALHNAANGNHAPVAQLLLAAGADKTLENGDGNTPGALARDNHVVALLPLLLLPSKAQTLCTYKLNLTRT
eukprot:Tamp_26152.p1 GENE.Tamp_26152~~Tamp_26152.p1  ORF type:complete len:222 (+),score=57.74 Tamp_26152:33-668(+)